MFAFFTILGACRVGVAGDTHAHRFGDDHIIAAFEDGKLGGTEILSVSPDGEVEEIVVSYADHGLPPEDAGPLDRVHLDYLLEPAQRSLWGVRSDPPVLLASPLSTPPATPRSRQRLRRDPPASVTERAAGRPIRAFSANGRYWLVSHDRGDPALICNPGGPWGDSLLIDAGDPLASPQRVHHAGRVRAVPIAR